MLYIIKFIYGFLLPPGIFIILLLIISLWFYRYHKWMARVLFVFTVCLYLFSIQITGDLIIHSLETNYQPPKTINGDVIVMLGAGATGDTADIDGRGQLSGHAANRLLTTARMYKKTHLPIIVSGGSVFEDSGNEAEISKRQLMTLGIPENKIIIENKSLNTEQNAYFTKKIMNEKNFEHPILVTSAFHMKRSILNFSRIGIDVIPYPTDFKTNQTITIYPNKFVPSDLQNVNLALKEYLGILILFIYS